MASAEQEHRDQEDEHRMGKRVGEPPAPEVGAMTGDGRQSRERRVPPVVIVRLAAAVLLAAVVVLWLTTSLPEWADPGRLTRAVTGVSPGWRPLVILALYVVGGLLFVPLTALVLATVWLFDPVQAVAYALLGALGNAGAGHVVGRWVGPRTLPARGWRRLISRLERPGVVGMTLLRLVPIAPYSVVNLAAGAARVHFGAYLAGTVLGLLPGLVLLAFAGETIKRAIRNPQPEVLGATSAAVLGVLLLAIGLRWLAVRAKRHWTR